MTTLTLTELSGLHPYTTAYLVSCVPALTQRNVEPGLLPVTTSSRHQEMPVISCEFCGAAIPGGELFCLECGELVPFRLRCRSCGAAQEGGARFCANCGLSLDPVRPVPQSAPQSSRLTQATAVQQDLSQPVVRPRATRHDSSLTTMGRRWELVHSLWVILTFTLLLGWLAFLYAGITARKRIWSYFAGLYALAPILAVVGGNLEQGKSYRGIANIMIGVAVVLALAAVVHALVIRREYLIRLEAVKVVESRESAGMREEVRKEFALEEANPPAPTIRTISSGASPEASGEVDVSEGFDAHE